MLGVANFLDLVSNAAPVGYSRRMFPVKMTPDADLVSRLRCARAGGIADRVAVPVPACRTG